MLSRIAKSAVARFGLSPHSRVPPAQIAALLARLHPWETEHDLIRLGGDGDGGYLVPDDLVGLAACFSPGVDVTASFEEAMLARNVPCFLADASVAAPPVIHPQIDFIPRFLGAVNDDTMITLDRWVAEKAPDASAGDLLLQMDIEGYEWIVLLNASEELLSRFRIIVLELHSLPHCLDPVVWQLVDAALDRLSRLFHVVHAHPNAQRPPLGTNGIEIPYLLEVTLLRKDRGTAQRPTSRFPHPLDRSNIPGQPDMVLPACLRGRA